MAIAAAQPVVIIPTLAVFQSTPVAGYVGSQAQLAYLCGQNSELDGGQAFYQLAEGDFSTPANFPSVIVDGNNNRWFVTTAVTQSQIVSALTTAGTLPGLDPITTQGANIASATTTDLSTATGNYINITGTTTITGLGTLGAGKLRFVTFTGILTLTHNATSLILPGGANITTAAGDAAIFVSLGSGNWKCIAYTEAAGGTPGTLPVSQGGTGATTLTENGVLLGDGTSPVAATAEGATGTVLKGNTGAAPTFDAVDLTTDVTGILPVANGGTNAATTVAGFDSLTTQGADIASATTTDLGAATGPYVNITGTTTITGLGTVAAGTERLVKFADALALTHNGTSLILPGAANITTAANDTAGFVSLGSGNWICLWYKRQSGQPLATALSAASIAFTSTSGVIGTTTNDNAAAGSVGEIIESQITGGSAVPLTVSGTAYDVTSISLTAGDWDVWGNIGFLPNAATTFTVIQGAINTTSATMANPNNGAAFLLQLTFTTGQIQTVPVGQKRLSLAGTTTVYLIAAANFAVNTMGAFGSISARRVR